MRESYREFFERENGVMYLFSVSLQYRDREYRKNKSVIQLKFLVIIIINYPGGRKDHLLGVIIRFFI